MRNDIVVFVSAGKHFLGRQKSLKFFALPLTSSLTSLRHPLTAILFLYLLLHYRFLHYTGGPSSLPFRQNPLAEDNSKSIWNEAIWILEKLARLGYRPGKRAKGRSEREGSEIPSSTASVFHPSETRFFLLDAARWGRFIQLFYNLGSSTRRDATSSPVETPSHFFSFVHRIFRSRNFTTIVRKYSITLCTINWRTYLIVWLGKSRQDATKRLFAIEKLIFEMHQYWWEFNQKWFPFG